MVSNSTIFRELRFQGGGIGNYGGTLTVSNSTHLRQLQPTRGAASLTISTATIWSCGDCERFHHLRQLRVPGWTRQGGGIGGGGIGGAALTVSSSILSSNSAEFGGSIVGGGVYIDYGRAR